MTVAQNTSDSRNSEFAGGVTSHAYNPKLIGYRPQSTILPTRSSGNGASTETADQSFQLKLPYMRVFGGQF